MVKFYFLLAILSFVSCSKEGANSILTGSCPEGLSPPSNLPLAPAAIAARPIHANGKLTSFNIQLNGVLNTGYNVGVYDVDLFDTSAASIAALKGSGKKVVCYFSAGSGENWRSDYSSFQASDLGLNLDGWPGEKWLDVRSQTVLDVMAARLDLAVTKGCDGVDPDNMDGFLQNSCFSISANEQLAYNRAIANLARSKGLAVGLKNDPTQANVLENYFDFSITEQCYYYNECASYSIFTASNKPVFNIEYDISYHSNPGQTNLCTYSNGNDIRTLVADLGLDDTYHFPCF